MKTKLFRNIRHLLLTAGCLLLTFTIVAAQNGVTVSGLAINAGTVTFNVSWNRDAMPVALWSDTVWVFVDYNNAGRMERLPLRTGATLTATSAPGVGEVKEEPGNNKGVWVIGNARTNGSFSATVQLLTSVNDVGGACVYGSNYPPVGEYISLTEISFTGTPVYEISLTHPDKGSAAVKSGDTFLLPCDYTLTSFTDKTGAPGIMKCIPMEGNIDFSVPSNISKGAIASFVVSSELTVFNAGSITYHWSAPNFSPATYEGCTFTSTTPAFGTYPVTLTAQSEGYCDLAITKDVTVVDCHAPGITDVTFANFNPCDASYGATYTLTDDRDGKKYKVMYLADRMYWTVENLAFGNCSETSWKEDNSATAAATMPTVAEGYVGHCRTNTQAVGFLYSWTAIMNDVNAFKGSTATYTLCSGTDASANVCRGICPVGWHLPTHEEMLLTNNSFVQHYSCTNSCCWQDPNVLNMQPTGVYTGSGGGWNGALFEMFESSTKTPTHWTTCCGCLVNATNNNVSYAAYVRCIRNY
jgi:uncharacterized protein (TIGR02145 family)